MSCRLADPTLATSLPRLHPVSSLTLTRLPSVPHHIKPYALHASRRTGHTAPAPPLLSRYSASFIPPALLSSFSHSPRPASGLPIIIHHHQLDKRVLPTITPNRFVFLSLFRMHLSFFRVRYEPLRDIESHSSATHGFYLFTHSSQPMHHHRKHMQLGERCVPEYSSTLSGWCFETHL